MISSHQFLLIVFISTVSVNSQLSDFFLRPALNAFNTLTGGTQEQTTRAGFFQGLFTTRTPTTQFQEPNNQQYQQIYQKPNNQQQQQNYEQLSQQNYRVPSDLGSCNNFFAYQQDSSETWGKLTINNPINGQNILEINLSLAVRLQTQYVGEISLVKDEQSSARDVANGLPLLYRIKFPTQNPLPKPVSVYLNDRLICSNSNDAGSLTTIKLKHTFNTGTGGANPSRVQYSTAPPVYVQQTTRRPIPVQQIQQGQQNNQYQSDNSVCGSPVGVYSQSLVIGGKRASKGEWPWLVAMYRSDSGNLEFFCGGNLISNTFVITAAHCLMDKQESKTLRIEFLLLFMGKYSLVQWNDEGLEKRSARRLVIHPDWNPYSENYDGDIALVEMESPVQFSKTIRPVCLWNFGDDLSIVVGQTGVVAGWGVDKYGQKSNDFPKKVNAPIVTNEQCLRSSFGFAQLTSQRTFCAGGLRGEGPCQGDSGGGLVLKQGSQWFIRGLVSASFVVNGVCDVNKYAVFTDVAKYMSWIRNQV